MFHLIKLSTNTRQSLTIVQALQLLVPKLKCPVFSKRIILKTKNIIQSHHELSRKIHNGNQFELLIL